jgi:hypothetical protein
MRNAALPAMRGAHRTHQNALQRAKRAGSTQPTCATHGELLGRSRAFWGGAGCVARRQARTVMCVSQPWRQARVGAGENYRNRNVAEASDFPADGFAPVEPRILDGTRWCGSSSCRCPARGGAAAAGRWLRQEQQAPVPPLRMALVQQAACIKPRAASGEPKASRLPVLFWRGAFPLRRRFKESCPRIGGKPRPRSGRDFLSILYW